MSMILDDKQLAEVSDLFDKGELEKTLEFIQTLKRDQSINDSENKLLVDLLFIENNIYQIKQDFDLGYEVTKLIHKISEKLQKPLYTTYSLANKLYYGSLPRSISPPVNLFKRIKKRITGTA